MMRYEILTTVLDNDPKGETGIGTVYSLLVTASSGKTVVNLVYGLTDVLSGKVDIDSIKRLYIEENKKTERIMAERAKMVMDESKSSVLLSKLATIDSSVVDAVMMIASEFPDQLTQAKNGNEKMLNFLVGQILRKHKFDPQIVKEIIGR